MEQTLVEKLKWAGIVWLARRLPDCKTLAPKLGESLDRQNTLRERIINRLHLLTCKACRLYLSQIQFISDAMHPQDLRPDGPPLRPAAKLSPDSKEKLKRALQKHANL